MSDRFALSDFDHLDASVASSDVLATYERAREGCPVAHVPSHGGYGLVTRHDDVRSVALDPDRFRSGDGVFIPPSGLPPVPPMEYDGAARRRWRTILQGALSPGAVKRAEPMIGEVIREHLAAFAGSGEAELVSQFAEPVPAKVIGRLIGLAPERAEEMREVALAAFGALGTDEMPARMGAFAAFIQRELDERREAPAGDYISQLAQGELDGERISDEEVPGVLVAFMLGGHHSTTAGLAGLVHHVLSVPGLRDGLRADPSLIPAAIEESLRCTTPLHLFARTVTEDTEIADVRVRQGERVMLNYHAANHDPRRYDDPERFRLDRAGRGHLAFGVGVHLCQGAALVRVQLRTAIRELLDVLPDLRLNGSPRTSGLTGGTMMGLTQLPVAFTPTDAAG